MTAFDGPVLAYDCESSGVDVFNDRIITACVVRIEPGAEPKIRSTVMDPGIEIPDEAAKVNGFTTERVRTEGRPPVPELTWIADDLTAALKSGYPVVIANAPFDLTILDAELRRHRLPTLTDRMGGRPIAPILDPICQDKKVEKYRRRVSETQGARCLKTLAQVHGVGWDDELAHTAEYDALQAGRVVWQLMRRYPLLAGMSLAELHDAQVAWYAEQSLSLQQFFYRSGNEAERDASRARDDDEREALLAKAEELRQKAEGVRTDWPILLGGAA